MLLGSIVNAAAILAGSAVGLLVRAVLRRFSVRRAEGGDALGDRLQKIVMQGLALCTMYIGISGALKGQNALIAILSIVLGVLLGEMLDLDGAVNRLGRWVQKKVTPSAEGEGSTVAEGFVTATLLFAVGAMAIVGSLNSGLLGDHSMLFAKALLDGISSIVFSISFGIGVPLSAICVFVYQAAITLAAGSLAPLLSDAVIAEMSCTGSLLIIAISLNMLGVTKIKVMNFVPAIFFPILLCRFM